MPGEFSHCRTLGMPVENNALVRNMYLHGYHKQFPCCSVSVMLVFMSQLWLWHGVCLRCLVTRVIFLVRVRAKKSIPAFSGHHAFTEQHWALPRMHCCLITCCSILSHTTYMKTPVDPEPAIRITVRLCRVHSCWGKMLSLSLPLPITVTTIWCEVLLSMCHSLLSPWEPGNNFIIREQEREARTCVLYVQWQRFRVRPVDSYVLCKYGLKV